MTSSLQYRLAQAECDAATERRDAASLALDKARCFKRLAEIESQGVPETNGLGADAKAIHAARYVLTGRLDVVKVDGGPEDLCRGVRAARPNFDAAPRKLVEQVGYIKGAFGTTVVTKDRSVLNSFRPGTNWYLCNIPRDFPFQTYVRVHSIDPVPENPAVESVVWEIL